MSLLDQAQLAQHEGFRDRVLVAAMKTAVAVAAEPPSGVVRTDDLRGTLATNVLNSPQTHVDRFAWAVVYNGNITYASNDGDIEYTVNSIWNHVAGV